VLGLRDPVLEAAARTAEALGAPGNPAAAVRRTRNKDECREALRMAGFRQPRLRLCRDAGAAAEFMAASSGPWVVKPRDGMGSVGVRLVADPADLAPAVAGLPDPGLFLVEEHVDGPEFSVEGVFVAGRPRVLAVTAKEKLPPPYFVELAHVLPADLPAATAAEVAEQVTAALLALDLRFGVFHVELWLTAAGVVLGEVHVRPGGDWLHALLGHAIPGLELFGLVFDDALGRPVAPPTPPVRGAATLYLTPPPGRLVEVRGWDEVLAQPDVLYAELTVAPGALVGPVRNSGDRAGVIVVGADTAATARTRAGDLADSLAYTMA
jgi:biotin carboxylase